MPPMATMPPASLGLQSEVDDRFSGNPERRAAELKASMYNIFWTLEDLGQPLPDLEVWLAQRAHIRLLVVLSRNPDKNSHVAFCLL